MSGVLIMTSPQNPMTPEQRAIIEWVTRDDLTADEWFEQAVAGLGYGRAVTAMAAKAQRHRDAWIAAGSPVD